MYRQYRYPLENSFILSLYKCIRKAYAGAHG
jgi:hypothetical protein